MYKKVLKIFTALGILLCSLFASFAAAGNYPSSYRVEAAKKNRKYICILCLYQTPTESPIPRFKLFIAQLNSLIWTDAGIIPDKGHCRNYADLSLIGKTIFVIDMGGHYAIYDIGLKSWKESDISREAGNQPKSSDVYMTVSFCGGTLVTSCFSAETDGRNLRWQRLPFLAKNSKIVVRDRHVFMVNDGEAHNAPLTIWQSSDCGRNWKPFVQIAENDRRIGDPDLLSRVHIDSLDVVGDRFWLAGCHGLADPNVLLIGEGKRLWVRRFPRMAREGFALTDLAFWDKRRGLLNFSDRLFYTGDGGLSWRKIYHGPLAYARMLLLGPGEALIPMESDRAFKVLWIHDYGKSMQVQTVGTLDDKQPTQPRKGRKR